MSTPARSQPTEEEMRAAYEAEIKKLRVEDVLIQTLVSLVNLGGRKAGLAPGTEDERDPEQLRMAIDGALRDPAAGRAGARPGRRRRSATRLSQLQMAYAQMAGGPAAASARREARPPSRSRSSRSSPAAAQSSGRLWVPGPVALPPDSCPRLAPFPRVR